MWQHGSQTRRFLKPSFGVWYMLLALFSIEPRSRAWILIFPSPPLSLMSWRELHLWLHALPIAPHPTTTPNKHHDNRLTLKTCLWFKTRGPCELMVSGTSAHARAPPTYHLAGEKYIKALQKSYSTSQAPHPKGGTHMHNAPARCVKSSWLSRACANASAWHAQCALQPCTKRSLFQ
jgi:hypothetical protein